MQNNKIKLKLDKDITLLNYITLLRQTLNGKYPSCEMAWRAKQRANFGPHALAWAPH